MKQTPTLSQLVHQIAATSDDATASQLFQELYSRICGQYYKAFYAVCYRAFKLRKDSTIAEDVYYEVLEETENDIRKGTFTVGRNEEDEVVRKRLLARMLLKAYWRVLNAYKRNKRKATVHSADLTAGQNRAIESIASSDGFNEEMTEALKFIYSKLSAKDADFIRTYFCEAVSKEDAQEMLMQKYVIKTDAAFLQAVARAKRRFKKLLQDYKTERISDS